MDGRSSVTRPGRRRRRRAILQRTLIRATKIVSPGVLVTTTARRLPRITLLLGSGLLIIAGLAAAGVARAKAIGKDDVIVSAMPLLGVNGEYNSYGTPQAEITAGACQYHRDVYDDGATYSSRSRSRRVGMKSTPRGVQEAKS